MISVEVKNGWSYTSAPLYTFKAYTNTHNFVGYKTAQSDSALDTCTEVRKQTHVFGRTEDTIGADVIAPPFILPPYDFSRRLYACKLDLKKASMKQVETYHLFNCVYIFDI